jgi:hypothetical protein
MGGRTRIQDVRGPVACSRARRRNLAADAFRVLEGGWVVGHVAAAAECGDRSRKSLRAASHRFGRRGDRETNDCWAVVGRLIYKGYWLSYRGRCPRLNPDFLADCRARGMVEVASVTLRTGSKGKRKHTRRCQFFTELASNGQTEVGPA